MIGVFARTAKRRGRHDIGGRIDTPTAGPQAGKRAIDGLEIDCPPRQRSVGMLQRLPCLYLVEDLEQDGTKENLAWLLRAVGAILDLTYEVLTDAVSGAVHVREPVSA